MKLLIVLLALVAVTKGLFLNRIIKTFNSPTPTAEPAVVLQPEEVPVSYKVNEYRYPSPVREIATTDLVYNPLFQNVIRQAVSQGASIDLKELSSPDYQKLIQIMQVSPNQITVDTPLYIPPANILPLEEQSRFFWPINAFPLPITPVETGISTSESKSESSEEESSEIQEPTKEVSSSIVNSSAPKNTEDVSPKEESNDIHQNLELPSENQATDFNSKGNVDKEVNSISGDEDFSHSYNLEDGTKVAEKGYVIKNEDGSEILAKKGSYEWIDANGKLIKVDWIADENGFRVLE